MLEKRQTEEFKGGVEGIRGIPSDAQVGIVSSPFVDESLAINMVDSAAKQTNQAR